MNENTIFIVSIIAIAVLLVGFFYLCLRIKYQYSVELDENTELISPFQHVNDTYSTAERDRLIEAIENGDFKDDRTIN